jgi:tetratricopeptide (TPR) repeat protein
MIHTTKYFLKIKTSIRYSVFLFWFIPLVSFAGNNEISDLKAELKNAKNEREKLAVLSNLAVSYCEYNMDSAIYFADSLKRMIKNKDPEILAKLYSVYGYVYERMGNYDLALQNQKKSLSYSLKAKNNGLIANSYNGVGVMYDFLGEYDKALENYFKSYKIHKKENNQVGMQQSLSNIGLVYHLKGDFTNALKYLYQSRDIAEGMKDKPGYTSALINIGLVFQQQKDYEKALEMYEEALEIYLEKEFEFDIALAYNNIGSVYYDMKDLKKSLFYHKKSLALKENINDHQGKVMSLQNLGLLFNDLNKYDSALIYLKRGISIIDSLPDPANEIELCNTIGSVYMNLKDYENAEKYLTRAMNIYNSGITYYKIYQTYKNLALLYSMQSKFKEAYFYSNKYWTLQDSIQNNENAQMIQKKELETTYEIKKREDKLKQDLETEALKKQRRLWNYFYLFIFSSLMIVIAVMYRNYRHKKKANHLLSERNTIITSQNSEIRKQSELIEEKNRDITDSIQYAKRLQDAMLPSENEMSKTLKNYFVLYQPKDIVSGDFYWMHDLSSKGMRKYLFAVVDCTGHGVPGGFVSIVGNNALNRAVNEFRLSAPNLILDKVSQLVEASFESENTQIRDGMDISMVAVTFLSDHVLLEYAGANNPLWILQNNKLTEIKADKQPVGKYENRKPFTLHKSELHYGDSVYLFSDGYADQFGGENGKKFKYAQLKEKLITLSSKEMKNQSEELHSIIMKWKGELEQIDDICIAGIKL